MARADGAAPPAVHRGRPRRGVDRGPHPRGRRRGRPGRTGAEERMTSPVADTPTRVQVGGTAGTAPYEVLIGRQLLGELPGLLGTLAKRVAVLHPEALAETGEAIRQDLAEQGYDAIAIQ
ncbi:3-dehydroquinate synthase, partial [Streptomyces asiaticus]